MAVCIAANAAHTFRAHQHTHCLVCARCSNEMDKKQQQHKPTKYKLRNWKWSCKNNDNVINNCICQCFLHSTISKAENKQTHMLHNVFECVRGAKFNRQIGKKKKIIERNKIILTNIWMTLTVLLFRHYMQFGALHFTLCTFECVSMRTTIGNVWCMRCVLCTAPWTNRKERKTTKRTNGRKLLGQSAPNTYNMHHATDDACVINGVCCCCCFASLLFPLCIVHVYVGRARTACM